MGVSVSDSGPRLFRVHTHYGDNSRKPILDGDSDLPAGIPVLSMVKKELRILALEDVAADVVLMNHELRAGGLAFEAKRVETRAEFLRELEENPPDLILSDHGLPGFDGFAALALARERCPETPFIFVTGSMGEEVAIDSLRNGATDYVLKKRISNLVPAVERALRLTDERMKRRNAELQAAYQEMEAFSYSISHDLRAPLIHIAGFAEMLKSDLGPALDEKSARHLQTICDSAENMGRMIADLLTFSRIGRVDMHKMRFKISDTVKEVQRDFQAQTQNRRLTWIIPPLPEVYGDPFLLRQAVFNLLGNALKYTRRRAEARIEITVETTNKEHLFAVRDNGAGFDMKYASKLFGVFQRLHSAKEFEGMGIGLANVRRIIGRHGGRTWAEGVVDGGATFYFSLPIVTDGAT